MRIHILGICGTFMGSLAMLARDLGHEVSGSDTNVYPPMSTQLEQQGIVLMEGYDPGHLNPAPDLVIVGNALSRGNPAVEYVLSRGLKYTSGPQWLYDYVLDGRWVLAVAGTHGKTTGSSMLAWILEYAGLKPGYLIGGVPNNFSVSARLGERPFFVVEADEYDSAFFDKRSKFIHYQPRTLVLNNLEFDHADIFEDLGAIKKQFHHLLRTVPENALIIAPSNNENLNQTLSMGCWTPVERFSASGSVANGWEVQLNGNDGSKFEVLFNGISCGRVSWGMMGLHNVANALGAIAAARHAGVKADLAIEALSRFEGVKRRMEVVGEVRGITVYDDFAHHPTAIETTLHGLRNKVGDSPVIAIIEPRSHSMRLGVHLEQLAPAVRQATEVIWYQPRGLDWDLGSVVAASPVPAVVKNDIDQIIKDVAVGAAKGDHIVIMSNGGFDRIHQRLVDALE